MRKSSYVLLALVTMQIFSFCKRKNVEVDEDKLAFIQENLVKVFTSDTSSSEPLLGLWKADQEQVIETMKEKFLKNYEARPDESSQDVLLARMKRTSIFINAKSIKELALFTLTTDGRFGSNISKWALASKDNEKRVYSVQSKKKEKDQQESTARIVLTNTRGIEKLEYSDNNGILVFYRETKDPVTLSKAYTQKIRDFIPGVEF